MADRIALYDLGYDEMAEMLAGWGEPRYRGGQVWHWLYRALAGETGAMANLPAALRRKLAAETDLVLLQPLAEQVAADGQTRKLLFGLRDGNTIESVLMLYRERRTVCISSQAGCGMGCVFCATGQGGMARNLSAGEIVAQVVHLAREAHPAAGQSAASRDAEQPNPISNVVLMGMGEPLANYAAVRKAVATLSDDRGLNLGLRRITISTVGLAPGIRRLAAEGLPVNLAVSLHAATDELRSRLVPINLRYPLAELLAAVRLHVAATGRRVSIEYALIAGVNDSPEQAQELVRLLQGLLCHVNLIPLNPTPGSPLQPSPRPDVDAFRDTLRAAGLPVTVRMRRGLDIEAGCGQLRQRQIGIAAG
jgi:23S rRNA (adenine2503-C2)-methyltransferase